MFSNDICTKSCTIFKDQLEVAACIFQKQNLKKSALFVERSPTIKKLGNSEILKDIYEYSGRKPSVKTMNLKNQKFHPPPEVCCRHLHGNPDMPKVAE